MKDFGKEFTRLKILNHRSFEPEKDDEEANDGKEEVHFGERGRTFQRNTRFIRSRSNPRFFRQARSQSWNNARSQSRGKSNQRFERIQGTSYWNNKDGDRKENKKERKAHSDCGESPPLSTGN